MDSYFICFFTSFSSGLPLSPQQPNQYDPLSHMQPPPPMPPLYQGYNMYNQNYQPQVSTIEILMTYDLKLWNSSENSLSLMFL